VCSHPIKTPHRSEQQEYLGAESRADPAMSRTRAHVNAEPYVVSLILGHAVLPGAAQATRLYDRALRLREVRAALDRWSDRIEDIVAGRSITADIVTIARA
jgi:hypothetical protein